MNLGIFVARQGMESVATCGRCGSLGVTKLDKLL